MPKYALDTNLYVDALRQPERRQALAGFLAAETPFVHLSAVVLFEILLGATSPSHAQGLERTLADPFLKTLRLFAPTAEAWRHAGLLMTTLRKRGRAPTPSLMNDLLIALSCREQGITLISRNGDFDELKVVVPGLEVVAAFPAMRG